VHPIDLRLQKTRVTYDLRKYYFTNRALDIWNSLIPNHMLFLIQLTCLNLGLINSGNIKILFMISKPKFLEPEVGAAIIDCFIICILFWNIKCRRRGIRHALVISLRLRLELFKQ